MSTRVLRMADILGEDNATEKTDAKKIVAGDNKAKI